MQNNMETGISVKMLIDEEKIPVTYNMLQQIN